MCPNTPNAIPPLSVTYSLKGSTKFGRESRGLKVGLLKFKKGSFNGFGWAKGSVRAPAASWRGWAKSKDGNPRLETAASPGRKVLPLQ
jgi:hypothetical protein